MSFKDLESPVEFRLEEASSRGVEKGKHGGYIIPVNVCGEDATKITDLAEENGAKNPVCGSKTSSYLYLKVKDLTVKQKEELLKKGRMNILVHFKFIGVYTRDDVNYLIHKVTKLRKLDKLEEDDIPED